MRKMDLLIKGGAIFDGTGKDSFEADIGIVGDKIAFISKPSAFSSQRSEKIIDARGLAVAPGFIDTHGHSDFTLLADPRAEGKLFQGVTTEINGNCGLSAAPLYNEAIIQREKDLRELGIRERWSTLREYLMILERRKLAINFVTLAGHGNIRASVIGYKNKTSNAAEIKKMQKLLKQAVSEGAIGLSTGLIYPPGIYSDTKELISLARILSDKDRFIYTSHMRSEGERLIEAIQEVLHIASKADIRVHISHIKTSGRENWHKIDKAISLIEDARKKGLKVTCDRYPYTAASTDLDAVLPPWVYDGGSEEEIKRLKHLMTKERIKKEILQRHPDKDYWKSVSVSSVSSEKNRWMEGRALFYISKKIHKDPVDTLFRILTDEKLRVSAIFSSMNEDNLRRFLSLPYTMIGSDSSARSTDGPTYKGKPHPRGFGTFPRFIGRYIRDEGLMSMSEAIYRVTMLPSKTFGINGRGIIKKGAFADITIFDPDRIIDKAKFGKPFLRPGGIYYVIVNGVPALWEGRSTGRRTGKILRKGVL
ncbi:MAG: D-aminoacylase [Nitrospirae bacterium]|nr:D-aminoacylase [Nitrospirota bacterium]